MSHDRRGFLFFIVVLQVVLMPVAGHAEPGSAAGKSDGNQDGNVSLPADLNAGKQLYSASLKNADSVEKWRMEGPGELSFKDGWMHMKSPNEKGHHVFWCPKRFPKDFIVQWEAQNLETDAGLCIVFFSAAGRDGEHIFDDDLPERTGSFQQYVNGAIRNYHISYYANAAHNPDRGTANLRKNPGKHLVRKGLEGIPTKSTKKHTITLARRDEHIRLWVDDRKVIDWKDRGNTGGPPHGDGFIGLRQMKWTHFRYRNFRVWRFDTGKQGAAEEIGPGEKELIRKAGNAETEDRRFHLLTKLFRREGLPEAFRSDLKQLMPAVEWWARGREKAQTSGINSHLGYLNHFFYPEAKLGRSG